MAKRRRFRSTGMDTHFVKFFIVGVGNRSGVCQAGELTLRLIKLWEVINQHIRILTLKQVSVTLKENISLYPLDFRHAQYNPQIHLKLMQV